MNQTVYIQCLKSRCVNKEEVKISDFAMVYCQDRHIEARVKSIIAHRFHAGQSERYVIDSVAVTRLIMDECQNVTVQSQGESDTILEYSTRKGKGNILEYLKVAAVCLITVVGGAFAVMAYNNDIGSRELFADLSGMMSGTRTTRLIMEVSYSLGLAVGIIAFYGHFGSWKKGGDPTPLEVEMRLYEDDVDTAVIRQNDREENND